LKCPKRATEVFCNTWAPVIRYLTPDGRLGPLPGQAQTYGQKKKYTCSPIKYPWHIKITTKLKQPTTKEKGVLI
jgi:hypothetical protein